MFPFPATLDGKPVMVYQLTNDRHACIMREDGRLDYVPATSLVVPTPVTLGDVVGMIETVADQIRYARA